jgi:Protein of unknown function (DUF1592)/Protein of unknown function (DUF1588)/Protein of unknown function (DUF1595)/Protein of unknown function (DUF1587)
MTPAPRISSAAASALLVALVSSLAFQLSCTGQLHGPGDSDDGPGGGDGEPTPVDCTELGPPMLRRLTSVQLRNSLEVIFQDQNVPAGDVLTDPVVNGFRVDATEAVIRDLDAQKLMTYAETVADWAVTQKLGQLVTCDQADPACRRQFIEELGRKVHRQPLAQSTVAAYEELFAAEASFADGAEVVIATMLQSPFFVYRREIGEPDPDRSGTNRLTPYELASNLSYMLTDRPPDDQLMAAAQEGRLSSTDDLVREAERLLATPEGAETLSGFVRGWLETDDLVTRAKVDPTNQLTDEVRQAMLAETDALFVDLFRTGGGVRDLLLAPYTFVNQPLGNYYQLYGAGGTELQRIEIPDGTRAPGILAHGSILVRHALTDSSSPVQRGKLVRERFLCEEIPPPPPNVNPMLGDPMGAVTTRQRYEQHTVDPLCRGCHQRMDLIGFAFEHYDGFGRIRDQEGGVPIDATGELLESPDGDIPLDGVESVSTYLAESAAVEECLVRYMSYYSYGLDGCNQQEILDEVAASGNTLKSIVLGIIRAPQFSRRDVQ